jgi:hypothetical protein
VLGRSGEEFREDTGNVEMTLTREVHVFRRPQNDFPKCLIAIN